MEPRTELCRLNSPHVRIKMDVWTCIQYRWMMLVKLSASASASAYLEGIWVVDLLLCHHYPIVQRTCILLNEKVPLGTIWGAKPLSSKRHPKRCHMAPHQEGAKMAPHYMAPSWVPFRHSFCQWHLIGCHFGTLIMDGIRPRGTFLGATLTEIQLL